jgi:hypothetical protein
VSSHTTDEVDGTAAVAGRTDSSPTTTSDASLDFALTPLLPSMDEQYGRYKSVEATAEERAFSAPLLPLSHLQSSELVPFEESLEPALEYPLPLPDVRNHSATTNGMLPAHFSDDAMRVVSASITRTATIVTGVTDCSILT